MAAVLKEVEFKLHLATFQDAKEVSEVVNLAFATDIFRKKGQLRTSQEEVEALMKSQNHSWIVIQSEEDKVKKIVGALLYTSESETEASIHMFSVLPSKRGLNLGLMLLKSARTKARNEKKSLIKIFIAHVNEKLILYYERFGFVRTGVENEYFPADLQQKYLIEKYQGYDGDKAKLRAIEMILMLDKKKHLVPFSQLQK